MGRSRGSTAPSGGASIAFEDPRWRQAMYEDERMMGHDGGEGWSDAPVPRAPGRAAEHRARAEAQIAEGAESTGPEHPSEPGPGETPQAPSRDSFPRHADPPMPAPPQKPPPGDWSGVVDALNGKSRRKPAPKPLPMFPMDETLVRYARQVEKDLVAAASAPPDEALLAKLASGEISPALELQQLQAQLSRRAVILVDHPDQVVMLARAMRQIGMVLDGMTRRVHGSLMSSASLRAQRRFLRSASDK